MKKNEELLKIYKKIKKDIVNRIKEFKRNGKNMTDNEILYELFFCLLTPQSKATLCWSSVEKIKKEGEKILKEKEKIKSCLYGVRFPNNKSKYIHHFYNEKFLKEKFFQELKNIESNFEKREFLVKNVKGMGYKEATHFLRNIGYGNDLAILDRHILKNLKEYSIIKNIPSSISRKRYIEIEEDMRKFSKKLDIPLENLDFVLWYKERGFIFK
uniref:8-oxoguanine DNA glycosylase/AP lyase n=1 Tax=candidate division WOR-3 bacterium TaxID=2052148 RepID=A0A7C3N7N8_UNCW3